MVMADILSDHAKPRVFPEARDQHLRDMANCIHFLSMDDPGAPMGMADIALSAPCALIFNEQDAGNERSVLGNADARVAVEAAVQMSWDRYLGFQGRFVGMSGFGESRKIGDVYKMFEITTEAVVHAAHESMQAVYG